MSKYLLILFSLLLNFVLAAQVNTEKFRSLEKNKGLSGAMELEGSFKSGNEDEMLLDIETLFNYKFANSKLLFVLNGEYNLTDDEEFSNAGLFHTRFVQNFGKNFAVEMFFQINFDLVRLIDFRELAGANLRYSVLSDSSLNWFTGAGVMQEYEKLSEKVKSVERESTIGRGNFYTTISKEFDNVKLSFVTYFQPNVTKLYDHRWLVETSAIFGVNKVLSFALNMVYRYDNDPPVEVLKRDLEITAGVILEI
ncbi:MAG: hypothetical protein SCALA702_07420 [Melioribacteraceae bacterium]|nr:MAG: hypothetical protein SCALA702_07420 [Melioribacteraceae bacterium]